MYIYIYINKMSIYIRCLYTYSHFFVCVCMVSHLGAEEEVLSVRLVAAPPRLRLLHANHFHTAGGGGGRGEGAWKVR